MKTIQAPKLRASARRKKNNERPSAWPENGKHGSLMRGKRLDDAATRSNPQQVFCPLVKTKGKLENCDGVTALAAGGCEACQLAPIGDFLPPATLSDKNSFY
jgi:hypothetical protein